MPQKKSKQARFGLGIEYGRWFPNNLNIKPNLSSMKQVNDNPYIGISLSKPWRFGLSFRSTIGYWKYYKEQPSEMNEGVKIISILFDVKYSLLTDVLLQPYVSYGVGSFLAYVSDKDNYFFELNNLSEMGFGINIGAGFNFQLFKKLSLALEFRYHYVRFNQVILFTDNYSGPKVNLAVIYLF